MVWGRSSVLQKFEDAKSVLHDAHTKTMRDIADMVDLSALDGIGQTLVEIGKQYGVNFESNIQNRLFVQNGSFASMIGLFDGSAPLTQKGTGSQRLLSMGLNIRSSNDQALLLIDEIETGLDPYRLRSLVNEFRNSYKFAGQVIMTTHSPIVVAECNLLELLIVHSKDGETEIFSLNSENEEINKITQGQIRKNAEAFLCKRLIVCEGRTEIGFVRALDTYLARTMQYRMAYKGVGMADGGGSTIYDFAKLLELTGYDVCLLMDSDLLDQEANKEKLRQTGISVFDWAQGNALEEQVFLDIPSSDVSKIIDIVVSEYGIDSVKNKLDSINVPYTSDEESIVLQTLDLEQKKQIGALSKRKKVDWFKRIDLGERLGTVIFDHWDDVSDDSKLKESINKLIKWVMSDRSRT